MSLPLKLASSVATWDERYAEPEFAYGDAPNDFLRAQGSTLRGPVLCLAEGQGRNAVFLATLGLEVTAVDQSAVGLACAEQLAARNCVAIQTAVADLGGYDLGEERWGAIVSIFAHVPAAVRKALHGRIAAALKPGGLFLLEAYRPEQLGLGTGGPQNPALMMSLAELGEELTGLEWLTGEEVEREIHEGLYHNGLSRTIQLIARKPDASRVAGAGPAL
jgi:SAM-dependent methyltransferase